MDRRQIGCLIGNVILLAWVSVTLAGTVSEEAQRYMAQGVAAVEMAKSPADYEDAISKFEKAKSLAPDWPDIYYNLGLVQEKAGKYGNAVTTLKQYLRLVPNAEDATMVKNLITKLEYKAAQEITKEVALDIYGSLLDSTKWRFVGDSSAYKNWVKGFRRDGDKIFITYIYDIMKHTTSSYAQELEGKAFTLKYTISFFNFCGEDCNVIAQYNFEIVSKNKVQVKAVEAWPEIRPYVEQKTKHLTFEYIRIQ